MAKPSAMLGHLPPDLQDGMRLMMDQAMIILVSDAGGTVDIPVSRIDHETKGVRMNMEVIDTPAGKTFRFKIAK